MVPLLDVWCRLYLNMKIYDNKLLLAGKKSYIYRVEYKRFLTSKTLE